MVKVTAISTALSALPPQSRLYLPGGSGEPAGVVAALHDLWLAGRQLDITTTFLPGVNEIDFGRLDPAISVTGLFMQPRYGDAARAGRYRHVPISYAGFGNWLDADATFDATVLQVAPPNAYGHYSLGPSAEFTMRAASKSRQIIAVVNPNVPQLIHAPSLTSDQFAYICEEDAPLTTYSVASDGISTAVARHVAKLIEDGAMLQIGIGKIPGALLPLLKDHHDLQFWSGMISDGVIDMVEGGALKRNAIGFTCMGLGTASFYDWLNHRDDIVVHGCEKSHDIQQLAALERFTAINGALEVDLLGQCNLERVNHRALSGAGGAPDFAHAARRSAGGKSIIALPAEVNGHSRIIASIGSSSMTTLGRTEVDFVVTENGIADLRFASVSERAERLIEVAAPAHRAGLRSAWAEIFRLL